MTKLFAVSSSRKEPDFSIEDRKQAAIAKDRFLCEVRGLVHFRVLMGDKLRKMSQGIRQISSLP